MHEPSDHPPLDLQLDLYKSSCAAQAVTTPIKRQLHWESKDLPPLGALRQKNTEIWDVLAEVPVGIRIRYAAVTDAVIVVMNAVLVVISRGLNVRFGMKLGVLIGFWKCICSSFI